MFSSCCCFFRHFRDSYTFSEVFLGTWWVIGILIHVNVRLLAQVFYQFKLISSQEKSYTEAKLAYPWIPSIFEGFLPFQHANFLEHLACCTSLISWNQFKCPSSWIGMPGRRRSAKWSKIPGIAKSGRTEGQNLVLRGARDCKMWVTFVFAKQGWGFVKRRRQAREKRRRGSRSLVIQGRQVLASSGGEKLGPLEMTHKAPLLWWRSCCLTQEPVIRLGMKDRSSRKVLVNLDHCCRCNDLKLDLLFHVWLYRLTTKPSTGYSSTVNTDESPYLFSGARSLRSANHQQSCFETTGSRWKPRISNRRIFRSCAVQW